jgi:hypothetical protein
VKLFQQQTSRYFKWFALSDGFSGLQGAVSALLKELWLNCLNFHPRNNPEMFKCVVPSNHKGNGYAMTCLCRHRGITPTHLQPGTRRWVVSTMHWLLYPRERPGTHCTGGWMGLGAGLDGMENLTLMGIRSPDRPAHSKSLYCLCYPCCLPSNYTGNKLVQYWNNC